MFLTEPLAVDVDLSSVAAGDLFATEITFETQAIDTAGASPASRRSSRTRRRSPSPWFVHRAEAARRADFDAPPVTVPAPAVCPLGPAPGAGTLQFSQPDYLTDETVGARIRRGHPYWRDRGGGERQRDHQ